ncbi:hypothetical protein [Prevotella disiens]|uniref:Uncharacterized protein n=1 Tax=Prevotella disiens DNF00882 TaxID=1401075 RepID=A0A096C675_9BACT|nr:hypothetical protein [Prevotella disiens]KGF50452.1 hypothetical protein HMPREF0654_01090 [Prevotella disiens DNF00882]
MDFSKRIEKESKKYGVAAQSLVLADLMSVGYTEAEAYSIAYAENAVLSFQQNQSIREGITKSGRFKEMLNERIDNLRSRVPLSDGEDMELMSTEDAAKQVLKAAQLLPEGSKERGEMFVKYTELLRRNSQVDAEPEEDNIRIYLPLKCNDCPLLQEYNERQKEIEDAKKAAGTEKE